jgi:hypothetical protein
VLRSQIGFAAKEDVDAEVEVNTVWGKRLERI